MSFFNRRKLCEHADRIPNSELNFNVEPLERRLLLSGNVLSSFLGDDLFLTGDDLGNEIEIVQTDGSLVVRGLGDTLINGANSEFVVAQDSSTFDGDIVARLFDGNDQFIVQDGITVSGDLIVLAGSGDDAVGIGESTVDGSLRVLG